MVIPTFNNLIGSPALNLVQEVVKPILQIVSIASKQIVEGRLVQASWHEDRITNQLRAKMIEVKTDLEKERGEELSLLIITQYEVSHTEKGRIDIAIFYSFREYEYFAIE